MVGKLFEKPRENRLMPRYCRQVEHDNPIPVHPTSGKAIIGGEVRRIERALSMPSKDLRYRAVVMFAVVRNFPDASYDLPEIVTHFARFLTVIDPTQPKPANPESFLICDCARRYLQHHVPDGVR